MTPRSTRYIHTRSEIILSAKRRRDIRRPFLVQISTEINATTAFGQFWSNLCFLTTRIIIGLQKEKKPVHINSSENVVCARHLLRVDESRLTYKCNIKQNIFVTSCISWVVHATRQH